MRRRSAQESCPLAMADKICRALKVKLTAMLQG
jgi:hypothetical protein